MSKEIEEWRDIKGFEGLYQISDWGRVKSLERDKIGGNQFGICIMHTKEKIMKPFSNQHGRLQIDLKTNGERETILVHKLVAETFIPNPNSYENIHHIDRNPQNNRVENLMWMDESEHKAMHSAERFSKIVYQYTLDGELVAVWKSASEAARQLGYTKSAICKCCNGGFFLHDIWNICETYKGYRWSYEPL